jgi:hypothetical protein
MKLFDLSSNSSGGVFRIQANVQFDHTIKPLWFEVNEKCKDFLAVDRYDAFLVSLLSTAMRNNESIQIEGAISQVLYENLLFYMSVVTPFYPSYKVIDIVPRQLTQKGCHSIRANAASFMLGMDSLNIIQHYFHGINYLVYANLGGFSPGSTQTGALPSFKERAQKVEEANDKYLHKQLIIIDSNIDGFTGAVEEPELHYGLMTMGAALVLQGLVVKYLLPSSIYRSNLSSQPLIPMPYQRTLAESLNFIHADPQAGESQLAKPIVNLCGVEERDKKDCSQCRECISSLVPASDTGGRELFFNVFDAPRPLKVKTDDITPPLTGDRSFYDNFDVSVVLPFYKKYADFTRVLPLNARYFSRPGVEVIIVMDEPGEEEKVLAFIKQYPQIDWVVIVNDAPHEWRNPTKALNVGIKHASKKYILVVSPESEMATDIMAQFRAKISGNRNFCIGLVHFSDYSQSRFFMDGLPYGSLMVSRDNLFKIGGYDEYFSKWGGDDDNLRTRLTMCGVTQTLVPEAHILHREEKKVKRTPVERGTPLYQKIFHPPGWLANNGSFGNDFNRIAYRPKG